MKQLLIVCLIIGVPFLIAIIMRGIGRRTLLKDYERDYNNLVHYVRECPINSPNFTFISKKFEIIERYKCRDRERLDVLKREFYQRFGGFDASTKECVLI